MSSQKREKMMIIDGNALIHRSFHALPPTITTKSGEMVNAVYGFASVFLKALKDLKPEYVVLTLDKKGPTFRHEAFKEYKATRVKAPDELYLQIPRVREVVSAFDVPVYELSGFEADDLIGTIANRVDGRVDKIIVTGDMDTLQLVNDHTKIYTMSHGLSENVVYDDAAVQARFGLTVGQMIDYKALRGDPSDNIPGVKGIGEKTAVDLLQKFGSLDKVYENIGSDEIKERVRKALQEHKDEAYMSRDLATIRLDAPIEFDLNQARFGGFEQEKVVKLFSELEFKSLLPRLQELSSRVQPSTEKTAGDKFARNREEFEYKLVQTEKEFAEFMKKLKKQKDFTFDTETTGFDIEKASLIGISFSWEEGKAYFVKMAADGKSVQAQNNLFNYQAKKSEGVNRPWLDALSPIFGDDKIKKSGHNMKFDIKVMAENDVEVAGVFFDTMIASYLLNPGNRQHNLDAVVFSELGFEKISKDDLLGRGKEKTTFAEVDIEKLASYSCEDADFTHRLVKKLSSAINEQSLDKLFSEIEMPLIPILAEMEQNGIKLDVAFLKKTSAEMKEQIHDLEKKIHDLAGGPFNIKSTQQLREVLFERLGIPTDTISKTKTGISTAAEELIKIRDQHEIIPLIQEYRELTKLVSTYLDALPELVDKECRLHTSFNQTIAATGRLSSTDPNLQNIPVRTNIGREIRRAFIVDKGYELVSLDYSQIELRIAAHLSQDEKMIKTFQENGDIHTSTAAEINGVKPSEVSKEMRREAKAINFGILYGQGPHGLAQTAEIPYARAKDFIDNYFRVYNGVKRYIAETIERAKADGYVETMFGRRRYLPEINSSVMAVRKGAERAAVNTPIQGTAADIIKLAMIKIAAYLARPEISCDVRMLLQVHDELVFEIKKDKVAETASHIKKIMEETVELSVPIEVDIKTGGNWGEMNKLNGEQ